MFVAKDKDATQKTLQNYFKSKTFQRLLIAVITVFLAFIIIESGAAPKRYKFNIGDKSLYDVKAPSDIVNKIRTERNKEAAAAIVPQVIREVNSAAIEVINDANDFINAVVEERTNVEKGIQSQSVAVERLHETIKEMNVPLSDEQVSYLISKVSDNKISNFRKIIIDVVSNAMKGEITQDNLANNINKLQNELQSTSMSQDLINTGGLLIKTILKPNRVIDHELTNAEKQKAMEKPENIVKVLKGERIVGVGETITEDKYEMLRELNLIESTGRFDFRFALGILILLILLTSVLALYMSHFCKEIFHNRNEIILLSVIILLTLLIGRGVYEFPASIHILGIPIFIAAMLISILLDLKLAIITNIILTIALSLIAKGDLGFVYMAIVSGTFSAFLVSKADQRSKLSLAGIIIGAMNVLIIICFGIINKSSDIVRDSIVVFLNGIASTILTIGLLPFLESIFNVITPLKLLEMANPNQPLIKRLLMEAPGTYHHSLMVGNLAEVATEAIGGNALLARVGAYYHDVGKLNRPSFFKENQLSDNPHDKMTANLSTLVITAHTRDGVELAQKYKIPLALREIIKQHHGTTLVAYFYHKAKKSDKIESVKQENYRYDGPKPSSKEAAVVMLADSVEAAVRSMLDKTEGKIEGLIRKLIKDKLDDGQLDLCSLTLKDLDDIAECFVKVLSGYFHEREIYPEVKVKAQHQEEEELPTAIEGQIEKEPQMDERKEESIQCQL